VYRVTGHAYSVYRVTGHAYSVYRVTQSKHRDRQRDCPLHGWELKAHSPHTLTDVLSHIAHHSYDLVSLSTLISLPHSSHAPLL
jgi:hypothetical protein